MNSSGIKRGLATTAVSALAIAGLPLFASSASAVSLSSSVPTADSVILAVADNEVVSARNDGTNQTVRLTALGGNNVTSVKFEYSLNGTDFTTIDTVSRNDNGAFAVEWNPNPVAGGTVTLRATPAGPAAPAADTATGVQILNTTATVNITDGTGIGVFQQPYAGPENKQTVIVSGTSSSTTPNPALSYWDASGQAFAGTAYGATINTTPTTGSPATGSWTRALDITGYDYGANDELLLRADDGSDDTEAFALYKQVITTVTATADKTQVQAGSPATVTVTVLDQNGKPIAGAQVFSSNGTGPNYTNALGQTTFSQQSGSATYYANATNSPTYEPALGDKQSDAVTVTQYNPAPTSLKAKSTDGAAFDIDEYTAGDITVQITDQNGNPIKEAGRTVTYFWTQTPFDGSPASQRFPATGTSTAVTDGDGIAVIAFPTGQTDVNGTYVLNASLNANALGNGAIAAADVLTVKAGEATFKYAEGSPEQAVAGGAEEVTGKLALTDGTGLSGRDVAFTYTRGAESGTGADAADANIVQADGTTGATRTVKTDAAGNVSVSVKDAVQNPQPLETGGSLAAAVTGNTDANPAAQGVDFIASVTPGRVLISADNPTTGGTPETDANVTPGTIKTYYVYVGDNTDTNTATPGVQDTPLSGQEVVLTLDNGYFTDGTPAAAPVVGADAGAYKNLGKTITATTNGSGYATVQIAIGRDQGFDDDGKVTSKLDAKAGNVTASQNLTPWDSSNPLNGGEVRIEPTAGIGQSETLPDAQVGETVFFDVFVTDQFGNLVGNELVTITENGPFSTVSGEDAAGTAGFQVRTDFINDVEFQADATRPNDQTITGSWLTETFKYTDTAGTTSAAGTETVTDTYALDWYSVDFATSEFSISQSPEGDVAVGTPVTETVKVIDENGNPVSGLRVEFVRQGAGSAAGGDAAVVTFTNANGEAFYNFTGTEAGTATVSAFISDGTQNKTLTDTVTFTAQRQAVTATLTGKNNGSRADVLTLTTDPAAAGALATLYKVAKDGTRTPFRFKTLDNEGKVRFRGKDKNGNRKTTYVATVDETDTTASAESNEKKVR
jgi:hypothetical protein